MIDCGLVDRERLWVGGGGLVVDDEWCTVNCEMCTMYVWWWNEDDAGCMGDEVVWVVYDGTWGVTGGLMVAGSAWCTADCGLCIVD